MTCSFEACGRPLRRRGLCQAHLMRQMRYGTPAGKNVLQGASLLDRVLRGLPADRTPEGCWEWQRARNRAGYGIVSTPDGRTRVAHRAAFEVLVGAIAEGLDLDHLCRNKPCCNPAHLEPVTRAENNRRMWPFRRQAAAA